MKVALVHDYLAQYGGAERVLKTFHEIWPTAPIYTSIYDPAAFGNDFAEATVHTSKLQRLFGKKASHKFALPFYPSAFESFDFSGFDLVLSSSTGFAKGIITAPETCHVCYLHTPSRIAWRYHEYIGEKGGFLTKALVQPLLPRIRSWDRLSSTRVDRYIANSANTARRIRKFYRRDSHVICAPVEASRFSAANEPPADYYLVVSRLVAYKRIDLAVEACTRLRVPLKVVGSGPDEQALRKIAGDTVQFLGRLPDSEVSQLMRRCRALIFPGEEDFGITPLECMASGRPVIAFGKGGALETVVENVSGLFFSAQTSNSVIDAIRQLETIQTWNAEEIRGVAMRFDVEKFKVAIEEEVQRCYRDYWEEYGGFSTTNLPRKINSVIAELDNTIR